MQAPPQRQSLFENQLRGTSFGNQRRVRDPSPVKADRFKLAIKQAGALRGRRVTEVTPARIERSANCA